MNSIIYKYLPTAITVCAIVLAITLHEFAHAFVALLNGDQTAKRYGRLTLNPIAHFDLIGVFMFLVAGLGWAKPVPVNEDNFTHRRLGIFTVAIAGIVVNIISAIIVLFIFKYLDLSNNILIRFLVEFFNFSILLAIFNLIPIPPLDGSRIVMSIIPTKLRFFVYGIERYSFILLFFLLKFGLLNGFMTTLKRAIIQFITSIVGI